MVIFTIITPFLFSNLAFGDDIKIWDASTGNEGGGNEYIKIRNTFNNLVGWNWSCEDVEFKYQIHYYVNYNGLDDDNRTITVKARLYEDDFLNTNDLIGSEKTVQIYGSGLGNYTSGLHYYIGPNGWIAKLYGRDGTIVGRSPSNATFSSIGYFTWTWSGPSAGEDFLLGWRVDAEFFAYVHIDDTDAGSEEFLGDIYSNREVPWEEPTFNVTEPQSGDNWSAGETKTISWDSSWHGNSVKLMYSTNGGSNITTIRSSISDNGSYSWNIPSSISSSNCIVRVIIAEWGYNYTPSDDSDIFTINPPPMNTCGIPSSITVPSSDSDGSYTVSWGSSSTSNVTYVLQEATNSSFSSGLRTAYSGTSRSTTITGRSSGTTYYYRVKATRSGYTDSSWRTGSNGCTVTITSTVGTPSSIAVPSSDSDGSYTVSWGSSSTSNVTYVLQEATNSSFSSGLRTAYSGTSRSTTITGRSSGVTYYYRVKATRSGCTDSSWLTGSNGCTVTITSPTVTITATDSQTSEVTIGSPIDYANFRVSRTGSTSSQLIVYFSKSGSAVWPSDYVWNGGPDDIMVIQPDSSYTDYSVRSVDDNLQEGNETITWTLVSHSAYTIDSPSSANITIVDNEVVPELSVTPNSRAVNANSGTTTFTVDNTDSGTMPWTASVISGEDWLSITSGSSGTNSGTITAAFSAITSGSSRTGTIRITASGAGGSPKDVTVTQDHPTDSDGDGIFDDGDFSGTVGDNPCTGGETENCDDNCLYTYNPDQADSDGDGIGDVCADDHMVTSDLWIKAVINTEEKGPIEAVWQKGGEDTTSRGDRVIWGHFYASPSDVTWGSQDNPDLFVKIWFDVSGRVDVNYFHVSVPDIDVYSDYPYDGTLDEQGTTTMDWRYIRQYYQNGQSYSEENYEDGYPPAGYWPTGNPFEYSTINDLRIGSIINTVEKGPIDALWRLGGQDTTSRGDQVVWGHFYASPSDVTWGSENNPDLFVKIWFDVSGRTDVNFFHVSVPDIEVYSDLPSDGTYNQKGTTIMDNRYIRHEY